MNFRKAITVLEIPLYLLIIGFITLGEGHIAMSMCLFTLSIIRLWVNHISYKEK